MSSESKESKGDGENMIAGNIFGKGLKGFIDDDKSVISGVDDSNLDEDFIGLNNNISDEEGEEEEEIRLSSSDDEGDRKII